MIAKIVPFLFMLILVLCAHLAGILLVLGYLISAYHMVKGGFYMGLGALTVILVIVSFLHIVRKSRNRT